MSDTIHGNLHMDLEGSYRVAIVDSNDNIIWEQPDWKKNLILNQGMDALVSQSLCALFAYAITGTGTRVNSFFSSGSFADVQGTILNLTASGDITDFTAARPGYAATAEIGDAIQFSYTGNPVVNVVSVSPTQLTVSPSGSFATGSFTIWKTSQKTLQSETKRTNTYVAGGSGTTFNLNVATHRRTWDFSAETASITYTEIGTSWAAIGNNNTFARVLLNSPISIASGQKMRLYYQMQASYFPLTPVSLSAPVIGWPVSPSTNTSGSQCVQALSGGYGLGGTIFHISVLNSNGTINGDYTLEPAGAPYAFISNIGTALQPWGTAVSRRGTLNVDSAISSTALTKFGWTSGSNTLYKTAMFTEASPSLGTTTLRSMGFGTQAYYGQAFDANSQCFAVLLDQNQTKTNTQQLTTVFLWTWARTLG